MDQRGKWRKELEEANKRPRFLTEQEESCAPWDRELCVICSKRTLLWLQPENAPICSDDCLKAYLNDPTVYDPRELYVKADPSVLVPREPVRVSKTVSRRKRPGRWEPDENWIRSAQQRIAKKMRGEDD